MPIKIREAINIAKDTAKDAGYSKATVTDTNYDEDEETVEVELESDDVIINVTIDMDSGDVIDFTTD